ncbi:hypothetical protein CHU92_12125 [Flavobacterium cyanobacteriorum]|uniref:DUF4468 domain-containing protein n=1 Tax=Flavobacterium cyanobacteriorum TaxID=2022802 RepID=A0A255YXW5_9FLAO|nr:hypothetical protein [Flavobacterium cyanobacteriorum]OYQ34076.1 hypothetical protein CHU92_12125 [Flavobacterium cyanobacteriorum]
MKPLVVIAAVFIGVAASAQPQRAELTRSGFAPVTVSIPATPNEKLAELTRNWAMETYQRGGYDITGVTGNLLTVSAREDGAFFYRNKGEGFDHDIRYNMELSFAENSYTATFTISEIYANDVRIEYNIPDYFTSAGTLKEDYEEVEPSLENTVNRIIRSHYNFIINFR